MHADKNGDIETRTLGMILVCVCLSMLLDTVLEEYV